MARWRPWRSSLQLEPADELNARIREARAPAISFSEKRQLNEIPEGQLRPVLTPPRVRVGAL